jgi:uncharacterized damage-inducible protein DinB
MKMHNIHEMYDYNYWANRRILQMAQKVTPEQFVAPSSHSYVSLQGTLVHILDAESSWRHLLQGQGFQPEWNAADFPTVGVIQQRWQEEERAMRAYLDGLHDEDLTRIVRYQSDSGAWRERLLWHCLYHVVNHGMQHRSEAANLLTTYRQSPGDIDFTMFLNERATQQQP